MHEEGGTVKPENIFGKERRSGKEVTQLIFSKCSFGGKL